MNNINIKKLVKEIKRLSATIKEHKKNTRRRHNSTPRIVNGLEYHFWESQEKLIFLKMHMTSLCCLRAHLRGKHHLQDPKREEYYLNLNKDYLTLFEDEKVA